MVGDRLPRKPYRGERYTEHESQTVGSRCKGELFPIHSLDPCQGIESSGIGLSNTAIISGLTEEMDPQWKHRLDFTRPVEQS